MFDFLDLLLNMSEMHCFGLMYVLQFLGWQQKAAETGMRQCANSSQWLNNRISLARYACNFFFFFFLSQFLFFVRIHMNLNFESYSAGTFGKY